MVLYALLYSELEDFRAHKNREELLLFELDDCDTSLELAV